MNNELYLQYLRLRAELTEAVVRINKSKNEIKKIVKNTKLIIIIVLSNEPLTNIDRQPTVIMSNKS